MLEYFLQQLFLIFKTVPQSIGQNLRSTVHGWVFLTHVWNDWCNSQVASSPKSGKYTKHIGFALKICSQSRYPKMYFGKDIPDRLHKHHLSQHFHRNSHRQHLRLSKTFAMRYQVN